jgi:serine/threonine-protein kinase
VPFKGETTRETCYQVIKAPLPRLRDLNPPLLPAVEAILLQALARDRDERFATGSDLEAALRGASSQIMVDTTGYIPPAQLSAASTPQNARVEVGTQSRNKVLSPGTGRIVGNAPIVVDLQTTDVSVNPALLPTCGENNLVCIITLTT